MGGHGHDHGHHAPYTVPKACTYKIENAKPLLEVQAALAQKGLKDPWARLVNTAHGISALYGGIYFCDLIARNEVWRYDVKQFGTHGSRVAKFMLRGLPLGAALAAGTIALEMALGLGGGHGHDEHGAGGAHH